LPPDQVIKTGSPMFEVLTHYRAQIDASTVLQRLTICRSNSISWSARTVRRTSTRRATYQRLVQVLNDLAEDHGLPVVVSTHPRTQRRIDAEGAHFHPLVRLLKPLGFHDYVRLQCSARAVLSDSGTITEEASILNFPALNLREAHERPEGTEEGVVMMVGLSSERVRQGLAILASQARGDARELRQVADYSMPNVSAKVLRIIHSYTDYVQRVVWRQYA
jgi:UDP-N-acetylglucosamine 2-epimerase